MYTLSAIIQFQGHLQTRVNIGCPPGYFLVFDTKRSSEMYNQYCSSEDDISCFYFYNGNYITVTTMIITVHTCTIIDKVLWFQISEFNPVFQVIDSVTEETAIYTGPYTLRAVAGGTRHSDMKFFRKADNV